MEPPHSGGASRDRTDDIQLAKLALSQLSYGPENSKRIFSPFSIILSQKQKMENKKIEKWIFKSKSTVGLGRFELPTSPLSGVHSNQLSYRPGALPASISEKQRTGPLLLQN